MKIAIIGGGIVGLNIALTLSDHKQNEIVLLEQEPYLGHHQSSRNSEVIHAGIAYPPTSLKARLCIEGNRLTYELLNRYKIPYKKSGKWVIAMSSKEELALKKMIANAHESGSRNIRKASPNELYQAEPEVTNITAVAFSPDTGIVDTAEYLKALEIELSNRNNTDLIYPCKVTDIEDGKVITNRGEMDCDIIINSAGLFSDEIYKMARGSQNIEVIPYKGEYYTWRKAKVNGLVYPIPRSFIESDPTKTSNFGIHFHKTVSGDVMVGPTQIRLDNTNKTDYSIISPPSLFVNAISPFVKKIEESNLLPAQAGNRAKLFKNGKPISDFQIFREGNIIHLLGIESPGLTAAPAIAKHVSKLI